MGKRYAVVLEVELLDGGKKSDVEKWVEHLSCRTSDIARVTLGDPKVKIKRLPDRPPGGLEVVFIYSSHGHQPCHAVVKKSAVEAHPHFPGKDSPWSKERFGFCGEEPETGPMPWCTTPDGGLCRTCAQYVEKVDGKWVTRHEMPVPKSRVKARPEPYTGFDDD